MSRIFDGTQWIEFETDAELRAYIQAHSTPDTISQYFIIVYNERQFCNSFQSLLLAKLREQAMTNADRITLLNTLKDAMNSLSWGDVNVSRYYFNSIATTSLWTAARKTWVLQQFDNYINS